jgi:hypothetical protein
MFLAMFVVSRFWEVLDTGRAGKQVRKILQALVPFEYIIARHEIPTCTDLTRLLRQTLFVPHVPPSTLDE